MQTEWHFYQTFKKNPCESMNTCLIELLKAGDCRVHHPLTLSECNLINIDHYTPPYHIDLVVKKT